MDEWMPNSPMGGLPFVKTSRSLRESSWDRTGGNRDFVVVEAGATAVMADIRGAGCIKHIWLTTLCTAPQYLRKLVLEMYWDGEENPSVRVPLGDFFGVGHAMSKHFVSLPISMVALNRNGPNGPYGPAMNSYFPMPFATGARIQIVNQSEEKIDNLFYHIDYDKHHTLPPDDMGRFHASWNRENPCRGIEYGDNGSNQASEAPGKNLYGEENYVILDTKGTGHYVGCVLSVDNFNVSNQKFPWFVEGDDMIFIDGEKTASIPGTGTEDYFNSAWCFPTGEYAAPYHGTSLASDTQEHFGKWSLYRFHIEDPIHFSKSIRVTMEHGHANDQSNDYSSVAYWYQLEPHTELPELPPVKERLARRWPDFGVWNR